MPSLACFVTQNGEAEHAIAVHVRRGAGAGEDLRRSLRTSQLPSPEQIDHRRVRILIADDHEIVRQGLRAVLDLDPALDVVGDAANGTQAVRLAHRLRPDVVLMDLVMPELDGIAATEAIRRELPDTHVVVLTSMLEAAAAGQVQISPHAAARLMRGVIAAERPETLSQRETDVLRLLARGSANKQIARDLGIAEKTVKTHVSSILGKLGVQSRT